MSDRTAYVTNEDIPPFTSTARETTENLRLDYENSPFPDVADNGDSMYMVKFKAKGIDAGSFPTEDTLKPPATSTGFTGSPEHIIPEFRCNQKGNPIKDGVVYVIDSQGNETRIGIFNKRNKYFKEAK